jgi:hypothetical protein
LARIQKDLKLIARGSQLDVAEIWERWRKAFALHPDAGDEDAQIVEVHDPTIVLDRERQLLVSEKTVQLLHDAVSWINQNTGVPQPDTGYFASTRNSIRQEFMTWPQQTRAA